MTQVCFGIFVMLCQPYGSPTVTDSYCKITKPIYWSPKDTRETKTQVDTHNRQWKAVCKGNKK
jgi:hypothetical protein